MKPLTCVPSWPRSRHGTPCELEPPFVIGTPGEAAAEVEEREAEQPRGNARLTGQPGHVTGTARILSSPDEGRACSRATSSSVS